MVNKRILLAGALAAGAALILGRKGKGTTGEGMFVDFNGRVSDAIEKTLLSGVVVQLRTADNSEVITSTMTDSQGYYEFRNILVPNTFVFTYSKSGYQETVTDPILLGESGGGLNVELVPQEMTEVAMYYTSPHQATHWDAYDLVNDRWLSSDQIAKRITEAYVISPVNGAMVLTFQESINAFFNIKSYGPYVVQLAGPGNYIWDAGAEKLNGSKATRLMGSSCNIIARILNYTQTNVPGIYMLTIEVIQASGAPGAYFIGRQLKVEAGEYTNKLVGETFNGTLTMKDKSPGELMYYPGFAWTFHNLAYSGGWPEWAFNFSGNVSRDLDYYSYRYDRIRVTVQGDSRLPSFGVFIYANDPENDIDYIYTKKTGPLSDVEAGKCIYDIPVRVFAHPDPNIGFDWRTAAQKGWVEVTSG